jgi:4-amino-4-deoxy-L-arabinose transferase-like glycosyltransferase
VITEPTPIQATTARIAPPNRALMVFLIAITLIRLAAAAGIHLTEDEAYYRLWAASPQFGYFDHPPMIAWWIRAGMAIAGDSALGVRLLPILSCAVTSLLVFDLTQRLGASAKTAERAAIWYNATLIIGVGGMLAVPDAAATLFWTLTLSCLARTGEDRGAGRWWVAAGVAAGLATISKYSGLFLAPGVLIWLLLRADRWKVLRRPWPWAAAGLAAAIFGANVIWNAEHHWVTFAKQFGRVAPNAFRPAHLLEFAAAELVLLNPIVSAFAIRGARRYGVSKGIDLSLPLAVGAPFAAYLVVHSLHARVEAHWPTPLYPALAILAACAAEQVSPGGVWACLRRACAPVGLFLSALALAYLLAPATDLIGPADPSLALRDWPGFARRVEADRLAKHAAWIGTIHYGTDAQLASELQRGPPVVALIQRERYPPTDSSWRADLSQPGLVVDLGRSRSDMLALHSCFASVQPLADLSRGRTPYAVYRVAGPRRDVLTSGCWASADELHAESRR